MPNEANNFILGNVSEDVLLPANKLKLVQRSDDIVKQAKMNALKIIKEAEAESESIHRQSYRAGYEQGLAMSIDSVCKYIDNSVKHAHEMEEKIREELRHFMSDIISEDDFKVKVVEHWLEGIEKNDDTLPLNILMPHTNRKLKDLFLLAIKRQCSGSVIFDFHDEPRFVFKYNNRLAEFYPEEFVYTTVDTLTSKYSLSESQVEISRDAIRYLHERLSSLYPLSYENEIEDLADE